MLEQLALRLTQSDSRYEERSQLHARGGRYGTEPSRLRDFELGRRRTPGFPQLAFCIRRFRE
jgi:hypothetical protein